jgi:UDPglucose 6-dehydrogenase
MRATFGGFAGKQIAVLGLAFKAGTDDMRDSPALTLLPLMQQEGARIVGVDEAAMPHARSLLDITFAPTMLDAVQDADAVVLMTELPAYVHADLGALRRRMRGGAVADLRRGWSRGALNAAGFDSIYRVGESL